MPWFNVDDGFHSHPKVARLRAGKLYGEALGLWVSAGSWACRHLTDGNIPGDVLPVLGFSDRPARELVRVGLWVCEEGGYRFCDWEDYQPSRQDVELRRQQNAERQKRFRDKGKAPEDSHVNGTNNALLTRSRNAPVIDPSPLHSNPLQIPEEKISSPHAHSPSLLPPARACVRTRESSEPEEPGEWEPESVARELPGLVDCNPDNDENPENWLSFDRMGLLFKREWLKTKGAWPNMHTRNPLAPRELFEAIRETAQHQGTEPEALLLQTLRRWIPTATNTAWPFAHFAQVFSQLAAGDPEALQSELLNKQIEAARESLRKTREGW